MITGNLDEVERKRNDQGKFLLIYQDRMSRKWYFQLIMSLQPARILDQISNAHISPG